ncbi:MAG: exo-alpha-sialidase [Phycisphaerae bacterium]|nr:exo-alpha-sialidase [Phycisphaerae bacterium]
MRDRTLAVAASVWIVLAVTGIAWGEAKRWIDPRFKLLDVEKFGSTNPYVRMEDGSLLIVDGNGTRVSKDGGKTWSERRVIYTGADASKGGRGIPCGSGQIIRSADGALVMVWRDPIKWEWDKAKNEPSVASRVDVWSIRSVDGGKTWVDRQLLHEGICGHPPMKMLQAKGGRIVVPVQFYMRNPGRNVIRTYVTDDSGKTWRASNIIDLRGHGHHDGALEPTMITLKDGRVWMLIRTSWGRFWEAISEDGGLSWRTIRPSAIEASTSPGFLGRLASGRIVLVWNRLYPEGKDDYKRRGGQFSDVEASWHREELSIAFSEDEGRTWTRPVVIAREKDAWLAYPYVFEPEPGVLWIFTGQGKVKVMGREGDLLGG